MSDSGRRITLVVAMARNRAIGLDGRMPWHLPGELKHFKATTMGHPIVMGRRTWQAIGRALPGRQNIVVSRDPDFVADGADTATSLDEALAIAEGDEVMIIGGGQLYRQALPLATRMVVTIIDAEPEADTWFPEWRADDWREVSRRRVAADERNDHAFEVTEWVRTRPECPAPGTAPGHPA
ncbi:MAG: dihydrofolate reductase [Xanthomonadales bacterium]|nr:dihydrofolate reductase [Xanthomonadales bacterium]